MKKINISILVYAVTFIQMNYSAQINNITIIDTNNTINDNFDETINDNVTKKLIQSKAGSLNKKFGNNGIIVVDTAQYITSIISHPSHTFFALGAQFDNGIVSNYLPDGTINKNFGNNGSIQLPNALFRSMTLQSHSHMTDSLLIAGATNNNAIVKNIQSDNGNDYPDFFSIPFNFGTGSFPTAIKADPQGNIVTAGFTAFGRSSIVTKMLPNGIHDITFGNNGMINAIFGEYGSQFNTVAFDEYTQTIIAGGSIMKDPNLIIARYLSNGRLDFNFNGSGTVSVDFHTSYGAQAIALQNIKGERKIVALCTAHLQNKTAFGLVRYNWNGSLDTHFGTNGIQLTSFENDVIAHGMTIDNRNRIIVVGETREGSNQFILARYNENGNLDHKFGNRGKVVTSFEGIQAGAYTVTIDTQNNIVVGGYKDNENGQRHGILASYIS